MRTLQKGVPAVNAVRALVAEAEECLAHHNSDRSAWQRERTWLQAELCRVQERASRLRADIERAEGQLQEAGLPLGGGAKRGKAGGKGASRVVEARVAEVEAAEKSAMRKLKEEMQRRAAWDKDAAEPAEDENDEDSEGPLDAGTSLGDDDEFDDDDGSEEGEEEDIEEEQTRWAQPVRWNTTPSGAAAGARGRGKEPEEKKEVANGKMSDRKRSEWTEMTTDSYDNDGSFDDDQDDEQEEEDVEDDDSDDEPPPALVRGRGRGAAVSGRGQWARGGQAAPAPQRVSRTENRRPEKALPARGGGAEPQKQMPRVATGRGGKGRGGKSSRNATPYYEQDEPRQRGKASDPQRSWAHRGGKHDVREEEEEEDVEDEDVQEEEETDDADADEDIFLPAKAIAFRGTRGCVVRLADGQGDAWLPTQNIKPLIEAKSPEALDAIKKAVRIKGLQVRIIDRKGDQPTASMWTVEEEHDWDATMRTEKKKKAHQQEQQNDKKLQKLRKHFDPEEWVPGTVTLVKNYGVFVNIAQGQDVLVSVSNIPESSLSFDNASDSFTPGLQRGDSVAVRILSYEGKDNNGRDRFRCSMMPPDADDEVQETKEVEPEPPARGRQFEDWDGGSQVRLRSVEELGGPRKTQVGRLAARGFAVVDDESAGQLNAVVRPELAAAKAKDRGKSSDAGANKSVGKSVQVWVSTGTKSKPVGFIPVTSMMTDQEKKSSALEMILKEDSQLIDGGAAVLRVDVTDKKIDVRVKSNKL